MRTTDTPPTRTTGPTSVAPLHLLLALLLVAVWGTNFVVIHVGLQRFPPLLFGGLRFTLAALPMVFILRRPAVRWWSLAAYGTLAGSGQFGLLFYAMQHDISPGLASLIVQMQVFITVGLSVLIDRETVKPYQLFAMLLAAVGLVIIALSRSAAATPFGIDLVLLAAASWAGSNLVVKHAGAPGMNMVAYIVWSSLFSAPVLLGLALATEGGTTALHAITHADAPAWLALVWQSAANTLFGYSAWAWLLTRYPAATITPVALLIPVFGLGASAVALGEPLPLWKVIAVLLVLAGLAVNLLWPRWQRGRGGM